MFFNKVLVFWLYSEFKGNNFKLKPKFPRIYSKFNYINSYLLNNLDNILAQDLLINLLICADY